MSAEAHARVREEPNPERSGAELVCDALEAERVGPLFGHPGGAILPLYDAIHGRPRLRHVLVRHEQAAAHAADGYARASGRTGVCLATSGPGATNLVTGLATAFMDSVPMVAITGQVPTGVMGTDAFQETDILGVTMAVTKHGFIVHDAAEAPEVIREAFQLARSGRPGPVLVDLPKDVQAGRVRPRRGRALPLPTPRAGVRDALERAARLLETAKRPVIMAGRGVILSDTAPALLALAERHRLPVITTLLGLDGFPGNHPLALGMPGMHGTARANRGLQEADLILGLGLRFDDRVTGPLDTFAPNARIVLFEVDPAVVGRTVTPDVAVIGDLRSTLPLLRTQEGFRTPSAWWTRLRKWSGRADTPSGPDRSPLGAGPVDPDAPPTGREAAKALARVIGSTGGQVATDVGQHQMWMAQELREQLPGSHLTSGGLGTMGYALPAAMGAAMARPGRPTWAVAGDGGFQMTLQEMATLVQEGLPVRIAVVNNQHLGMVRQWQELYYGRRYAASRLSGPDLTGLAAAYGIPARRVSCRHELEAAVEWASAEPGPAFLELRVAEETNVYPMVPPGIALDGMIEEPPGSGRPPTPSGRGGEDARR